MPLVELAAFARDNQLSPEAEQALYALFVRLEEGSVEPTVAFEASVAVPDPDYEAAATLGTDQELGAPTLVTGGQQGARREGHAEPTSPGQRQVPVRYEDRGVIGMGGMGEVRRVRDRELGRTCALKVIREDLLGHQTAVARFVEESQVAAQLQHPNIPPVYDAGRLPDGRKWFTMKEVRGRTLTAVLREVHAASVGGAWRAGPSGWTLHRLVDALSKVCDGVGYAHGRGVVHRDLKPENVMVGSHGEVLVLDWGLAKVLGRPERTAAATAASGSAPGSLDAATDSSPGAFAEEPKVASSRSADDSQRTRDGGVLGTAAYMPPEQARGEIDHLDARADVYALGAILYELLAGRPPYVGRDSGAVLQQVLAGPPEPPGRFAGGRARDPSAAGLPLPDELVALSQRCMERNAADRPPDATAVGAELRAWLEGARKREKALELVAAAGRVVAESAALEQQAAALRAGGATLLAQVKPWAPEEQKAAGWSLEDQAERATRELAQLEFKREGLLLGALTHAPELVEAHAALAELELSRHKAAEAAQATRGLARAEVRLREHTEALPEDHPVRRRANSWLRGDGALTLLTDAPGASVELLRYEVRNRRLVAVPVRSLGRTPLRGVTLPMGSYLCLLRHPERADLRYPVQIGRGEHWDCVAPGEQKPRPVRLPGLAEQGPEERVVPAGWFWSGGDQDAVDSLPRRRLWCHEFVARRFPVTHREYLAFLDELVSSGREAEALRHAPRERVTTGEGPHLYGRDREGRFVLRSGAGGEAPLLDSPAILVDWFGATAWADWLAARTGKPYRLLGQLEWEKAARGVDGRAYPWGDAFDPSWCCVRASHPGAPQPAPVDSYPVDESVYGVRGLGGNVEDWCADAFRREGPLVEDQRVVAPDRAALAADATSPRVRRGGGYWYGGDRDARAASQARIVPGNRYEFLGFRVGYAVSTAP